MPAHTAGVYNRLECGAVDKRPYLCLLPHICGGKVGLYSLKVLYLLKKPVRRYKRMDVGLNYYSMSVMREVEKD